jgi:hypothetical protein
MLISTENKTNLIAIIVASVVALFALVNTTLAIEPTETEPVLPASSEEAAAIVAEVAGQENKEIIAGILEEEAETYVYEELAEAERTGDHKKYLYVKTMEEGLSYNDAVIMDGIVTCESGWYAGAANPTSTASGLFQFLDTSWAAWGHGNVFDGFRNIDAGVNYYAAAGQRPWVCPSYGVTPIMSQSEYVDMNNYLQF